MTEKHAIFILLATTYAILGSLSSGVVVHTSVGDIVGDIETVNQSDVSHDVSIFLGIPYAEQTDGHNRFAKPVKKPAFKTLFHATNYSLPCPSNVHSSFWSLDPETGSSEDCLYLNVYAARGSNSSTPLPVMVWFHDGQYQVEGSTDDYDIKEFAAVNGIILVTFNYRVSVFGFLADPSAGIHGNYGLWDQQLVIQWVHDNIAGFGGDPKRVTLFGNSTGAANIMYQVMYPGNKGLFSNIILQGGSANAYWALDNRAEIRFLSFSHDAGCRNESDVVECLRDKSTKELESRIRKHTFLPVIDGEFVTVNPIEMFRNPLTASAKSHLRAFSNINVIIGRTKYKGLDILKNMAEPWHNISSGLTMEQFDTFSQQFLNMVQLKNYELVLSAVKQYYYDWLNENNTKIAARAMVDLITDIAFTVPILETIDAHVQLAGSGSAFLYDGDDSNLPPYTWIRSGNPHDKPLYMDGFPNSPSVIERWVQFSKSGSPNIDENQIQWEQYNTENRNYINFESDGVSVIETLERNMAAGRVRFWRQFVPLLEDPCKFRSTLTSSATSAVLTVTRLLLIISVTAVMATYRIIE